jgi:hypothetical protein
MAITGFNELRAIGFADGCLLRMERTYDTCTLWFKSWQEVRYEINFKQCIMCIDRTGMGSTSELTLEPYSGDPPEADDGSGKKIGSYGRAASDFTLVKIFCDDSKDYVVLIVAKEVEVRRQSTYIGEHLNPPPPMIRNEEWSLISNLSTSASASVQALAQPLQNPPAFAEEIYGHDLQFIWVDYQQAIRTKRDACVLIGAAFRFYWDSEENWDSLLDYLSEPEHLPRHGCVLYFDKLDQLAAADSSLHRELMDFLDSFAKRMEKQDYRLRTIVYTRSAHLLPKS